MPFHSTTNKRRCTLVYLSATGDGRGACLTAARARRQAAGDRRRGRVKSAYRQRRSAKPIITTASTGSSTSGVIKSSRFPRPNKSPCPDNCQTRDPCHLIARVSRRKPGGVSTGAVTGALANLSAWVRRLFRGGTSTVLAPPCTTRRLSESGTAYWPHKPFVLTGWNCRSVTNGTGCQQRAKSAKWYQNSLMNRSPQAGKYYG